MKGDLTKPAVVYIVTNKVNGKRYIGVTSKTVRRRMVEHFCHAMKKRHNGAFYRAIQKYGKDAFKYEVLLSCQSCHEALKEEIRLIAELKPEYNSTLGGDGRLGCSLTMAGSKRLSDFHRGNKWHLGIKHNVETVFSLGTSRISQESNLY